MENAEIKKLETEKISFLIEHASDAYIMHLDK